jgi:hypothetical protein
LSITTCSKVAAERTENVLRTTLAEWQATVRPAEAKSRNGHIPAVGHGAGRARRRLESRR